MIPQSFHSLYVCLGLLFITGCKLLFRVVLPSGTGKNIVHKTISVGPSVLTRPRPCGIPARKTKMAR